MVWSLNKKEPKAKKIRCWRWKSNIWHSFSALKKRPGKDELSFKWMPKSFPAAPVSRANHWTEGVVIEDCNHEGRSINIEVDHSQQENNLEI